MKSMIHLSEAPAICGEQKMATVGCASRSAWQNPRWSLSVAMPTIKANGVSGKTCRRVPANALEDAGVCAPSQTSQCSCCESPFSNRPTCKAPQASLDDRKAYSRSMVDDEDASLSRRACQRLQHGKVTCQSEAKPLHNLLSLLLQCQSQLGSCMAGGYRCQT